MADLAFSFFINMRFPVAIFKQTNKQEQATLVLNLGNIEPEPVF